MLNIKGKLDFIIEEIELYKYNIFDDSLIGPACTVWQQLAIGLEADWVEALEKNGDSDDFYKAVLDISTKTDQYGAISYSKEKYGFGLNLDIERLRQDAVEIIGASTPVRVY